MIRRLRGRGYEVRHCEDVETGSQALELTYLCVSYRC